MLKFQSLLWMNPHGWISDWTKLQYLSSIATKNEDDTSAHFKVKFNIAYVNFTSRTCLIFFIEWNFYYELTEWRMVIIVVPSMKIFRCGNIAAILELDENLNQKFRVFEAAPHVCHFHWLSFPNFNIYNLFWVMNCDAGVKRGSFQKTSSRLLPLELSSRSIHLANNLANFLLLKLLTTMFLHRRPRVWFRQAKECL